MSWSAEATRELVSSILQFVPIGEETPGSAVEEAVDVLLRSPQLLNTLLELYSTNVELPLLIYKRYLMIPLALVESPFGNYVTYFINHMDNLPSIIRGVYEGLLDYLITPIKIAHIDINLLRNIIETGNAPKELLELFTWGAMGRRMKDLVKRIPLEAFTITPLIDLYHRFKASNRDLERRLIEKLILQLAPNLAIFDRNVVVTDKRQLDKLVHDLENILQRLSIHSIYYFVRDINDKGWNYQPIEPWFKIDELRNLIAGIDLAICSELERYLLLPAANIGTMFSMVIPSHQVGKILLGEYYPTEENIEKILRYLYRSKYSKTITKISKAIRDILTDLFKRDVPAVGMFLPSPFTVNTVTKKDLNKLLEYLEREPTRVIVNRDVKSSELELPYEYHIYLPVNYSKVRLYSVPQSRTIEGLEIIFPRIVEYQNEISPRAVIYPK